ncbi:MAG: ketoacyl-ACP synthase III [Deltaproteobacteria bacterium]|jgi:3-oxoacyl-[acyl-carrier-protein] synthase-3|nr:ketoacyl-ACP synthase III [Deltaproteobacteria bacterium]
MAKNIFHHATISGISAVVPKDEIRLEDELRYFGGDIKKARRVTRMVGIDRRRVAEEGVLPSDLCQQAAENLFAGLGLDRSSVDALIFVSQSPDYFMPATACILQDKLGLPQTCAAFDVNQGCTGYVYGLWLAFSLVESRAASRVLLLEGDGLARLTDQDNRIVAPVFGDCGTATLVDHTAEENVSWFMLGTDGSGAESLMIPAGRGRLPPPRTPEEYAPYCEVLHDANGTPWRLNRTYMDGGAVFDFTLNVVPEHILELLRFAQKTPEQIDSLVLHQANRQIMRAIADKVGFPPEKVPMEAFGKYGNLAGASIPSAICDALAEDVQNSRRQLLLSGFGVGLSWASAILATDQIWCSGMREYEKPAGHPLPKDILAYWRRKITGEGEASC